MTDKNPDTVTYDGRIVNRDREIARVIQDSYARGYRAGLANGALVREDAPERPAIEDGHDHTASCQCLPIRVVVDQHGHYWRDYGDHWSMCPVSDENVATTPVTEFYRLGEGGDLEDAPSREGLDAVVAAVVADLGQSDGLHQYDRGIHRMPGCAACSLRARLAAALAATPPGDREEPTCDYCGRTDHTNDEHGAQEAAVATAEDAAGEEGS